jgi:Probable Zinc-ribbon domain
VVIILKRKTLAEDRPDLLLEWHPTKNIGISPHTVTKSASIKVWWVCRANKVHEWQAFIANRNRKGRRDGCPFCSGRYATKETSLLVKYPELANQWHPTKNGELTPDKVKTFTSKKVWWLCSKDDKHEWQATVGSRQKNGCPYCSGKKPTKEHNLQSVNPVVSKEWHPSKNKPMLPKDVTPFSNKKVWWKCSTCSHEWIAIVNNRAKGRGCPICKRGLQTSFPEQSIYFYLKPIFKDIENGRGITFGKEYLTADILIPSLRTIIEYDGEYAHKRHENRDNKKNRLCLEHQYKLIRIREPRLPELSNPSHATILRKDTHSISSLEQCLINVFQKLIEIVENIDVVKAQKLNEIINTLSLKNDYIQIENSIQKYTRERSLKVTHPLLQEEWCYEKNINLKPEHFTFGSRKKVWWICSKKHSYLMSISDKVRGNSCSYCSGRLVNKDNCLLTLYPKMAKQWHRTKNGTLTPNDVTAGSPKKIWWGCDVCNNDWIATVNHRTNGTGCPFCNNKKTNKDNCLANTNPELAIEWHPKNNRNLTPFDVTAGSDKKVWWLCKKCNHEWETNIYHRNNGTGCPLCMKKRMSEQKRNYYKVKGLEKLKRFAAEYEGQLVSNEFMGMRELHQWKCKNSHKFIMTPRRIHENKNWCPKCN